MDCYVGIDLGSTTTKSVIMDADGAVLGRGITNSRSNYDTAARVAHMEAVLDARFTLVRRHLDASPALAAHAEQLLADLDRHLRLALFVRHLADLERHCRDNADDARHRETSAGLGLALDAIFAHMREQLAALFAPGAERKSDFFRDSAGAEYMHAAETLARGDGHDLDSLLGLYDKAIIQVENQPPPDDLAPAFHDALEAMVTEARAGARDAGVAFGEVEQAIRGALDNALEDANVIGTGYGRARLPFPKEHIRSEILCHGLGAHLMYPGTRTVLDIGGQDTKGIQVDARGIVTNFQMNDRCAAGCGRYLGYIADEMNVGLHELGPMAMRAAKTVRINSTCTVFAGAELRDRLALGERREDIVAGLHRAIILRAMSIISRSGGITDQFTFTGGVAKNEAAVKELRKLVAENYGEVTINIDPNSIYTGAQGAAEFARRAGEEVVVTITAGIDLGSGSVKTVVFEVDADGVDWLGKRSDRIRRRDPLQLAEQAYDELLASLALKRDDVDYAATTGEGEAIGFRTGHFYSMTTHARGAIYLEPAARSVLDIGALHGRAIKVDGRGKVLGYRMTSQCASGSGQFLENIARYLGIAQDEIGSLSLTADDPETVSSICAVLAETDVINMVSRGITAPNILKGIHLSMADRFVKLLRVVKAEPGLVFVSGGLAADAGLTAAIDESLQGLGLDIQARTHPDSIYAGAIGAALWGAFRYEKLAASGVLAKAAGSGTGAAAAPPA